MADFTLVYILKNYIYRSNLTNKVRVCLKAETSVAGSEIGSGVGVGTGSGVGAETSIKVGSGIGSETNHYGSTTLKEILFFIILISIFPVEMI
jgi:hypothetical protein